MSSLGGRLRDVPFVVIKLVAEILAFWKSGRLQEVVAQGGSTVVSYFVDLVF